MDRFLSWADLPTVVQQALCEEFGEPVEVIDTSHGQNCELAISLRRESGQRVFVKGVRDVGPRMRWLRNESEQERVAVGIAPPVLYRQDVKDEHDRDWLLVGFEYLSGRSADLAPGSPDLPLVASLLGELSYLFAPDLRPLSQRWAGFHWWDRLHMERPDLTDHLDLASLRQFSEEAVRAVRGDRLIHTDLHEDQFRITDSARVQVIDWGWPASGESWVDTAFMVIRLIAAGHKPSEAESWARQVVAWEQASSHSVTAFAAYVAGLWSYRSVTEPRPGSARLAEVARNYAMYRIDSEG